jgi:hypothetical protein
MLMNSAGEWIPSDRSEILNNTLQYRMAKKKLFKQEKEPKLLFKKLRASIAANTLTHESTKSKQHSYDKSKN